MRHGLTTAACLAACVTLSWAAGAASQSEGIFIAGATVVDGTGFAPRVETVIVQQGRIARIDRPERVQVPAGATVLDGRGKFLIPGLWDMHVHLGAHADGAKALPRLLAYGIVGVRDMASPVDDILTLRRETAAGTIPGPEIVAAGPILQRPLPFTPPPLVRTVKDPDATQAVDDLRSKGVDFIKVGDTLTREAYLAIAAESKRVGLPFAGHLPGSVTALEAASAGQRSIEHFGSAGFRGVLIGCSSAEDALLAEERASLARALAGGPSPDDMLSRAPFLSRVVDTYDARKAAALFAAFERAGTWQVPTLVAITGVWNARRAQLGPADAAAIDRASGKTIEMFADMRRAGVKILAGSDTPIGTGVPPIHDELVELVRAGLSPMEALQASTRNAAQFLGRQPRQGTIEIGKQADLVLLDADPLADVANTRRVSAVIARGRLITGAELQRLREPAVLPVPR